MFDKDEVKVRPSRNIALQGVMEDNAVESETRYPAAIVSARWNAGRAAQASR